MLGFLKGGAETGRQIRSIGRRRGRGLSMDDYDDRCYECTGYGDDYSFDSETGEYVRNCYDCPYNGRDPEAE